MSVRLGGVWRNCRERLLEDDKTPFKQGVSEHLAALPGPGESLMQRHLLMLIVSIHQMNVLSGQVCWPYGASLSCWPRDRLREP